MASKLFDRQEVKRSSPSPLADRMRPSSFEEFVGQDHLVSPGKPLRVAAEKGQLYSLVFWGPPGSGKTTLARILAVETGAHFEELSAVSSKLAEVRQVMATARERKRASGKQTVFFLDEIHRFNKLQQDALLPAVEKGEVVLIGATTENPSFEVISPLLSRLQVYTLDRLTGEELVEIARNALKNEEKGLGERDLEVEEGALEFLINYANGDARAVLNGLEAASRVVEGEVVNLELIEEVLQKKALRYDKDGEEHYNLISAFIKSLRGSDPDAALYYLARMIEAGEDPLFIARRMVIFASEDIGMASPTALVVANGVFRACETIGPPECGINLAHGVVYLATCPKSNSAYAGYNKARADVKKYGNLPTPLHLRNAPTHLMKELGYGQDYQYPHNFEGHHVAEEYLPEKLKGRTYYSPTRQGQESKVKKRIGMLKEKASRREDASPWGD